MTYPILPGGGPIPASPAAPRNLGFPVTRPCACGTPVTASRLDPWPGVAAHNASTPHAAWWERARAQWQGEEAS